MQFRVLGPLEVRDEDGEVVPLTGPKERMLLAALLIDPASVVSAERLIDILWGEDPPRNPVNALQARVSALRRSLGDPNLIVSGGHGYRLSVGTDDVDMSRFEGLITEARALDSNDPARFERYDEALSLWHGRAFAEIADLDFARAAAVHLEELRTTAIEERAQTKLDCGRHGEVVSELERLVLEHPLRERFWAQLMLAQYRSGRQADALRTYQEAARVLGEELGIEPSPELQRLEEAVLSQDPALDGPTPTRARPIHNLPARITSLVGRSEDVARIGILLAAHRIITLTGPGGVGKTSLAIACGESAMPEFADGVCLVEFGAVTAADLVPAEIARGLGLDASDRLSLDLVRDFLSERQLLLILDNCEHLVDTVARTAQAILEKAPRVQCLATSREPLGVPGEILWPTRPLSPPEEGKPITELATNDAVRLFLERARAARPEFAVDESTGPAVVEICRRLDGLPLAIELAAARVRNLPVTEISARLGDRFRLLTATTRTVLPRQMTLEATIRWSYELLGEDEKDLLRRLAVFAGGWTLEAAEAIVEWSDEVLRVLSSLIDRSLIVIDDQGTDSRYSMLETIRAFADQELAVSGDRADAISRHAAWCLRLAESAEFQGPDQTRWVARLSLEYENLRAALLRAIEEKDFDTALRLGSALGWLWFFGNRDEGRRILDQLLKVTEGVPDRGPVLRARAILDLFSPSLRSQEVAQQALDASLASGDSAATALARILVAISGIDRSEVDSSFEMLTRASDAFVDLDDPWGQGFAHFQRMEVLAHRGELTASIAQGQLSLTFFRETGDPWAVSAALAHLAKLGRLTGRIEWGSAMAEEALRITRSARLPHTSQYVLTHQAYMDLLEAAPDSAIERLEEALQIAIEVGNRVGVASIYNGMGEARLATGAVEEALQFHQRALTDFEDLQLRSDIGYTYTRLGLVHEDERRIDQAMECHREGLSETVASGDQLHLVPCLEGLGRVTAALGDFERAARLLHAGTALRSRVGLAPLPIEAGLNKRATRAVADHLEREFLDELAREMDEMETTALGTVAL
jgi:predicted ATPase/DNA-binding SARP family transcriptional activator